MMKATCIVGVALGALGLVLPACGGQSGVASRGICRTISPASSNATPQVVAAVRAMRDGDTLRFEKGVYHFYEEGTVRRRLNVLNGKMDEKKVLFDFDGRKNVTVDGGGSTFIWHGNVFPFAATHCEGVRLMNFTTRAFRPSFAEFRIVAFHDDGFTLRYADDVDWRVKDGAILIETDLGTFDSREKIISLHSLDRCCINYLFVANEKTRRDNLAAPFMNAVAEDCGDGTVRVRNRHQNLGGCMDNEPFKVGEPLAMLLNGRERCGAFFADSKDVVVKDVAFESGDGMGIISLFNENLTIDGYRVVPKKGGKVSITADCLYVVNNRGKVEVKNTELSWSMDDAVNMHGTYLRLVSAEGRKAVFAAIHESSVGLWPFRVGDVVEFSAELPRRDVLGTAKVVSVEPTSNGGVTLGFDSDVSGYPAGTRIEDISALPSLVHIHDSAFHDTMHLRLSGRNPYLVEHCRFERGLALLISDLSGYWGESGRTADMTIRDNTFVDWNARGWYDACIVAEVEGRDSSLPPPKIHRGIKILDNRYSGLRRDFVCLPCAEDPVVEGNEALSR